MVVCGLLIATGVGLVLTVTNSLTLISAAGHGSPAQRGPGSAVRVPVRRATAKPLNSSELGGCRLLPDRDSNPDNRYQKPVSYH